MYKSWISLFLMTPTALRPTHSCSIVRAFRIVFPKASMLSKSFSSGFSLKKLSDLLSVIHKALTASLYHFFCLFFVTIWDWDITMCKCTAVICSSSITSFFTPFLWVTTLTHTASLLVSVPNYISYQPLKILVLNSYS